jgi:hypothetical protein
VRRSVSTAGDDRASARGAASNCHREDPLSGGRLDGSEVVSARHMRLAGVKAARAGAAPIATGKVVGVFPVHGRGDDVH